CGLRAKVRYPTPESAAFQKKPLVPLVGIFVLVQRIDEAKACVQQSFKIFNRDRHDIGHAVGAIALSATRDIGINEDDTGFGDGQSDATPSPLHFTFTAALTLEYRCRFSECCLDVRPARLCSQRMYTKYLRER